MTYRRRGQFVVDNATDGFSLYDLETADFIRKYATGIPKRTYPKQVTFGEESRVVVGGSDHGVIYVFDRKSGRLLDVLGHAKDRLVLTVGVSDPLLNILISSESLTVARCTHPIMESILLLVQHRTQPKPILYPCGVTTQLSLYNRRQA